MDFTTNYCGPYWSSGKIQSSVAHGLPAVSQLDQACKEHDRAYALAKSQQDLVVADNKFYNETRNYGIRGPLYGSIVKYGNKAIRDSMAFVLPFLGLVGASAASTVALSTQLPKGNMRGSIQETAVEPDGQIPTICYDPKLPGDSFADIARKVVLRGSSRETPPNKVAPEPPQEQISPVTKFGLYKPLGRRKMRLEMKNKNKILPQNAQTKTMHVSPANKTKTLVPKQKPDHGKTKQTKEHVDQETCTHPEIRACYNYKYCARCNREFHPGQRAYHKANAGRSSSRR